MQAQGGGEPSLETLDPETMAPPAMEGVVFVPVAVPQGVFASGSRGRVEF